MSESRHRGRRMFQGWSRCLQGCWGGGCFWEVSSLWRGSSWKRHHLGAGASAGLPHLPAQAFLGCLLGEELHPSIHPPPPWSHRHRGSLGSLQLQVRLRDETVLPPHCYQPLVQLLCQEVKSGRQVRGPCKALPEHPHSSSFLPGHTSPSGHSIVVPLPAGRPSSPGHPPG